MVMEVLHMRTLEIEVTSKALADNPLGDPHHRILHALVPEDLDSEEIVPCVWWLAGYAGTGRQMLAHDGWQEGLGQRLDRLRRDGYIGKMVVALPDAFTRFGGCQYLSSPAVGDYETYLWEELPRALGKHVHIGRQGVAGKSSGGFGAIHAALRQRQPFAAVACHSGDMGFEISVLPDLVRLMDALRVHGSVEALVGAHYRAQNPKDGQWFGPLSMLALAAVYSPSESSPMGIELPFAPETGRLRPEVVQRWREWDPVDIVAQSEDARRVLAGLRMFFIDCGLRDEHGLHWGARQLAEELRRWDIAHEHQEFDGGHRSTSYRLDVSLPKLYSALV